MIETGRRLPDVRLTDRNGRWYDLYDFLDRPTLLIVFKRSCPTCQMALPVYDHWRRYEPAVKVLAISQDTPEETDEFYHQFGLGFETLYDPPPYGASNELGIVAVPSLILVERGQVEWAEHGWNKGHAEELAGRLGALAEREPILVGVDDLPIIKPG